MNMNIKQIIRAEPCLMILQVNVVLGTVRNQV